MPLLVNTFQSFGLDIGDRSLKAACIKKRGKDFALESFGEIAIPAGVFLQGEIQKPSELSALIVKLLQNIEGKKIRTDYVHACLPESETFIKLITLDAEEGSAELPALIREELPNHIPMNIDEMYIDWQILESDDSKNKSTKVLVGAIAKKISDSYTSALINAGLKPLSLQIEAEPITRSLLPIDATYSHATAIVDIGATRASFICFDKGAIQFTVSIPLSSGSLTALISQKLSLTMEEAEKAKKICGMDPENCEGALVEILEPSAKNLALAIQKNINFYTDHFDSSSRIESIVLCGGGANMPGLVRAVEKHLPNINVALGNPLINITKNRRRIYSSSSKKEPLNFLSRDLLSAPLLAPKNFTSKEHLTYTTAIGLALTNVSEKNT